MSATSILINVGAQTASAVRELANVNDALKTQMTTSEKWKSGLKAANKVAVAAFAGIATASGLAVKAASDQEQAFGGIEAVFGKQAGPMKEWAKQAANIGLSAADAATQANLLGSQLKGSGASAKEAAKESQRLVGLGADLAATYGGTTAEAVEALNAAFRGEFDSIEKFGVSLKQSDVNARLAAKGQDKLTGTALKQAEAIAKQELIWERTKDAQGGAARESETFAAQMQQLQASVANTAAALGQALLPYVARAVEYFKGLAQWIGENITLVQIIAGVIAVIAGAIIALNAAMKIWQITTQAVAAVNLLLGTSFTLALGPVLLIIAAIAAVIAIGVLLYKNWDTISAWLKQTWESIKDAAVSVWNSVKDFFVALWDGIKQYAKNAWEWIKNTASDIWNGIKNFFVGLWDGIKSVFTKAFEFIKTAITTYFNFYKSIITGAWNIIKTVFTTVLGAIRDAVEFYFGLIRGAIERIINGIKTIFSSGLGGLLTTAREKMGALIDFIKSIPERIKNALGNFGTLLYSKGRDLIQGLIDGIKSMLGKIPGVSRLIPGLNASQYSSPTGFRSAFATSSLIGARAGGTTYNVKVYGTSNPYEDARVIKRILEGYDISQGRAPGVKLARAW